METVRPEAAGARLPAALSASGLTVRALAAFLTQARERMPQTSQGAEAGEGGGPRGEGET